MAERKKQLTGKKLLQVARQVADDHGYDICEYGWQELVDTLGLDYHPSTKTWLVNDCSIEFEFAGTQEEALAAVHKVVAEALASEFPSTSFTSGSIDGWPV